MADSSALNAPSPDGHRDSGITLSALRTFIAVVDVGSFSRAAAGLGVSQPSVSAQLIGLERACGVLLLRRRPRMDLTEAGRDLLVRARLIVGRLAEFENSVSDLQALRRGRLMVGQSSPQVAMGLIGAFLAANPAIQVFSRTGNTTSLLADVAQCQVDVAITSLQEPVPGLVCRWIRDQRLTVCVPRDHPLAGRTSVSARDLVREPLIWFETGSFTNEVVERAYAAIGEQPQVRLQVNGREAVKAAVAAGVGLGFVFAHEAGEDARLAFVPLDGLGDCGGVYMVTLEESLDIPVVRAFVESVPDVAPLG